MRILFVCDYYPPHMGGGELVYKRYCEGLVSLGHSVEVVTLRHPTDLPKQEVVNGVAVHRVDTPRGSRYLFALSSLRTVLARAKNADVVHCAFFAAPFSAIPAAKIRGKPVVVTVHEVWGRMWFKFERNPLRALMNYLAERLLTIMPYDAATCYSFYTFNSLRILGVDEQRIHRIPTGVDFSLFEPKEAEADLRRTLGLEGFRVYMFYGRPGISKGIEYLVRAAASVKDRIKDSKLLMMILGKEPIREYSRILNLIHTLELEDHIRLLDPVPREELPRYVALADVVVVPSLSEGFGFVAAEATAMGKPVVATYGGSLPEVVAEGESGLLVKPGSSTELCHAICTLLEDEAAARRMGTAARLSAARFSRNSAVELLEALYNRIVKIQ